MMIIDEVKIAFKENKLAIYFSIAILFVSIILGYIFEPSLYSYFNPVVEAVTKKVQSGVIRLTFKDIFLNNLKVIFQMFIYGLILCISALILSFNGFLVGYYVASTGDLFVTLMLIIPHGIFEFSSCILACASGFVLFNFLFRFLKTLLKQENDSIIEMLSNSFDECSDKLKQAFILFGISIILMVIAGIVETYLTIPIAQYFISILR